MFLLLALLTAPVFAGGTPGAPASTVSSNPLYASNEIQITWYPAYPHVIVPVSQYDATDFFESDVMPAGKASDNLWHFTLPAGVSGAIYSEILVDTQKRQVSVVVDGKIIPLTRDPSGSRGNTESFLVSRDH